MEKVIFLNYYKAKGYAESLNLKECEYGDCDDRVSYCAWNKSGDRNKKWEVVAYYIFRPVGFGAKPEQETSPEIMKWAGKNL